MQIIELQKPLKVTVTIDGGTLQGVAYMFRGYQITIPPTMITIPSSDLLVQLPGEPLQWVTLSAVRIKSLPEPCVEVEEDWYANALAKKAKESVETVNKMLDKENTPTTSRKESISHDRH